MNRRLVIITEIISPYRIPLFNALARNPEVDLHVIFLAETDPELRQWKVYKQEIRFSYEMLPSWRKRVAGYNALLNRGIGRALAAFRPDVILCGGYNYLASWYALMWARRYGIPFFLWSESTSYDSRPGRAIVELLKNEFIRLCSGFVVPGQAAFEYLKSHRIREDRIFTAVNAVDNPLYSNAARSARINAMRLRADLKLPPRYFLFVGRLVEEKGVFDLLSAYATLDARLRDQIGLVFVGDGQCRADLELAVSKVPSAMIRIAGFAQREELGTYYGLAEMLILPTHTDTWGLVVNEGMACALPIILSRQAGCSLDLVRENWNGRLVPANDTRALASAMQDLATDQILRESMGANSLTRIGNYTPEHWSEGILRMMSAAGRLA